MKRALPDVVSDNGDWCCTTLLVSNLEGPAHQWAHTRERECRRSDFGNAHRNRRRIRRDQIALISAICAQAFDRLQLGPPLCEVVLSPRLVARTRNIPVCDLNEPITARHRDVRMQLHL